MFLRSLCGLASVAVASFLLAVLAASGHASDSQKKTPRHADLSCVPAEEASQEANKETCVSAHVFDVVELADGTRFLDVCPPETPDEQCKFTFMSLLSDRNDVGDLRMYRDQNVKVRGIIRFTHGRMGIIISHARQFRGGPEKFKPNPKLLYNFDGESDRMPVHDPNLKPSGRHRSFMNTRDRESLPEAAKH
jgi:hypothetical protein